LSAVIPNSGLRALPFVHSALQSAFGRQARLFHKRQIIDTNYGVFEGRSFKADRFADWLAPDLAVGSDGRNRTVLSAYPDSRSAVSLAVACYPAAPVNLAWDLYW
jgi:hypothetical protein